MRQVLWLLLWTKGRSHCRDLKRVMIWFNILKGHSGAVMRRLRTEGQKLGDQLGGSHSKLSKRWWWQQGREKEKVRFWINWKGRANRTSWWFHLRSEKNKQLTQDCKILALLTGTAIKWNEDDCRWKWWEDDRDQEFICRHTKFETLTRDLMKMFNNHVDRSVWSSGERCGH